MSTVAGGRLAAIFVEVADTLVDEFDLIEFLQMIADRTAGLLDAATVGILLADPKGRLQFMAASSEATRLLELFQLQGSDGPCLDAYRSGTPVVNADLPNAAPRWPRFAPVAASIGFRSVHAFPLRLRKSVIGAMGIFGTDTGDLDDTDVAIVQAIADVAAIGLLQQRAISRGEVLAEQLQGALSSRIVIEQAKGVLAQAQGIPVEAAFDRMRAYARRGNRRLGDVAQQVVRDIDGIAGLLTPADQRAGGAVEPERGV